MIPSLGALQFNLTNAAGIVFVPGSEVVQNTALGSAIFASQNTATATTVGIINGNANGFTPDTLPIMKLTDSITTVGFTLPTFSVASGTIEALQPDGTVVNLAPSNFVVTTHFNTDTF